jgi:CHASE3 domain sensor protein
VRDMARQWTFGQRLAVGFAVTAALTLVTGVVTVWALTTVAAGKDQVIDVGVKGLARAQELRVAIEAKSSAGRAFLLTGDQRYTQQITAARAQFSAAAGQIREVLATAEERDLLDQAVAGEQRHQDELQTVMTRRASPERTRRRSPPRSRPAWCRCATTSTARSAPSPPS